MGVVTDAVKWVAEDKFVSGVGEEEWLDTNGAMAYLKISSKTTLQKIREENSDVIRFVRLSSKLLLYFKPSLDAYLQQNLNA